MLWLRLVTAGRHLYTLTCTKNNLDSVWITEGYWCTRILVNPTIYRIPRFKDRQLQHSDCTCTGARREAVVSQALDLSSLPLSNPEGRHDIWVLHL